MYIVILHLYLNGCIPFLTDETKYLRIYESMIKKNASCLKLLN